MYTDIKTYSESCPSCKATNVSNKPKAKPLTVNPFLPFQVMACDFAEMGGKRSSAPSRYKHVLVFIDLLAKFVVLVPVRSTKAGEVVRALHERVFPQCGLPNYRNLPHPMG